MHAALDDRVFDAEQFGDGCLQNWLLSVCRNSLGKA
jgi:hypothetical protein